jgi:phosphorylcholine metabolism protein LicD
MLSTFLITLLFICVVMFTLFITWALVYSPYTYAETPDTFHFGNRIHKNEVVYNKHVIRKEVHQDLMQGLKLLLKTMDEQKVDIWASKSTLLGAVRHGGVVPWWPVLHFCVSHSDMNSFVKARPMLEESNEWKFRTKRNYYLLHKNNVCKFPYIKIKMFAIQNDDVALCTPLTELNTCSYEDTHENLREIFKMDQVFPLKQTTFENMQINIPNKSHECLQQMYGSSYETETNDVPTYIHLKNPKTINILSRVF